MSDIYFKPAANVVTRYVITGRLKLLRPTSLSNGDIEGLTDIALRRDAVNNKPVLPGTSLAGALRDYLIQRVGQKGDLNQLLVKQLFGFNEQARGESHQSWLFIEDAFGEEAGIEIRGGVVIDPESRTAADKKKFDIEFLAAGTTFNLCIEFWEPSGNPLQLRQLLAQALLGLQKGEISLGGRKRRGFGECKVEDWQVHRYSMSNKADIVRWLEQDKTSPENGETLTDMLTLPSLPALNQPRSCRLQARFALDGSLLIRSAAVDPKGADQLHLRNAAGQPVISGSSLAGVLRARARRIVQLLQPQNQAAAFVNDLFGQEMKDKEKVNPKASRLWVREMPIREFSGSLVADRVQSRVKIDRFTGGSYPTALFDQQPVFQGEVTVDVTIQRPHSADVGLLLLLLKDLWTGDLAIGGESSVGRGRMQGQRATLTWNDEQWRITTRPDGKLDIDGERDPLEAAVKALKVSEEVSDE
ncbi:MAG: hypothetical protein KDE48_20845 [Anaerolineales bacterium]|nr:hypothetical protein [Anaerolineales bacterium]